MSTHIIKYEYQNGKKLDTPITWCGRKPATFDVYFLDLQHFALHAQDGSSWGHPVCKNCVKKGIAMLSKDV